MTATPARTDAATAARRATAEAMIVRVKKTLTVMTRDKTTASVAAVARRAGVSRTFLYQNPTARALIAAHVPPATYPHIGATPDGQEETWRQRALNGEAHIKRLTDEITLQRARLGELLGQVRELEAALPADGVERLRQDNRALRQENQQLTRDNRRMQERLTVARDTNRFLDRRTADLETQLLQPDPVVTPAGRS